MSLSPVMTHSLFLAILSFFSLRILDGREERGGAEGIKVTGEERGGKKGGEERPDKLYWPMFIECLCPS